MVITKGKLFYPLSAHVGTIFHNFLIFYSVYGLSINLINLLLENNYY